jgi:hypothetical protein
VAGVTAGNAGLITACRSSNYSGIFNRLSTDGDIVQFRKDSTTVGSIGATSGVLTIGNNNSGGIIFGYNGSHTFIEPSNTSGASVDDGATLGSSSKRFRDLYLSGNAYVGNAVTSSTDGSSDLKLEGNQHIFRKGVAGSYTERWRINSSGHFTPAQQHTYDIGGVNAEVRNIYAQGLYIGGSAAANKLDDYEEGTWSPTIGTGTATFGGATYTKVGRLVTCHFTVSAFSDRTSGNAVTIASLPFAAEDADRPVTMGSLAQYISSGFRSITGGYLDTTTSIRLYNTSTSGYDSLRHNELTSASSGMYIAFSYMANS